MNPVVPKPDYATVHDKAYRARRERGEPGWQDDESLKKTLSTLQQELQRPFVPKSGKALELGCGAGDLTLELSRAGFQCTGVDLSPTAIDWAREKSRNAQFDVQFTVGNVLALPELEDSSFDLVLDGYCFHCIIGEDRLRFLNEVKRLLRPGGSFLLLSMCGEKDPSLLTVNWDRESGLVLDSNGQPTRYIASPESILEEVRQAGLHVIDWRIHPQTSELNDFDELIAWIQGT